MPTLLPKRPTFTGESTTDLGSLTHALIGSHVQHVHGTSVPPDLLQRMMAVAYAVIDANPNRTRVLATEAASGANLYLTTLVPAAPWRLLDVEYDTGDGRVDVAWTSPAGQVYFDELKTNRVGNARHAPPAWLTQASRYASAGVSRFGDDFLGVRLIPLMAVDTVRLVRAGKPVTLLAPTAEAPLTTQPRGGAR